jgi:hypothetical protein
MGAPLKTLRRWFAEELRHVAHVRSRAVVDAFATVPRERFVGPGPWRVRSPMRMAHYWTTDDADPRHVYHDVLIALDKTRGLNNGQPSLWAALFDDLDIASGERVLHLGCGIGYFTARSSPSSSARTARSRRWRSTGHSPNRPASRSNPGRRPSRSPRTAPPTIRARSISSWRARGRPIPYPSGLIR